MESLPTANLQGFREGRWFLYTSKPPKFSAKPGNQAQFFQNLDNWGFYHIWKTFIRKNIFFLYFEKKYWKKIILQKKYCKNNYFEKKYWKKIILKKSIGKKYSEKSIGKNILKKSIGKKYFLKKSIGKK